MADINVFGTLHAATGDGVVVRAAQVLDEALNKKQHLINQQVSTNEATLSTHSNILTGNSSEANARQNAFVNLGTFNTWVAVNAALDGLMADRTANKYNGRLKFDVTGGNYEVVMFIRAWNTSPEMPVWVQRVSGPLSLSGGVLASGDTYMEYVRYSDASGTVSAWAAYPDLSGLEAADAAILATALGTGTENAYDVPMKNVKFMSDGELIRRINSDFMSGTEAERGLVRYRYSQTGNNILVLTQGLCESRYPTNAQRGCVQMAIGGCKIGTTTTDDQSHDWTEEGITNAVAVNYTGMQILARKLSYDATTGERIITQWTNVLTII